MNKVAKIALMNMGYSELAIIAILEVSEATGNLEVAIEKILGVYEEPYIAERSKQSEISTFLSYNPFSDSVEYEYMRNEIKYNRESGQQEPTGKKEKATGSTKLDWWNKNEIEEEEQDI